MPDLKTMTWDELQAVRFALVARQAVADKRQKAEHQAAQIDLVPIITELQARDQAQIDAAITALEASQAE